MSVHYSSLSSLAVMSAERCDRRLNTSAHPPTQMEREPPHLFELSPPPPYIEVESFPQPDQSRFRNHLDCDQDASRRPSPSDVPTVLPPHPTRRPPKPPKWTGIAESRIEDGPHVDRSRLPPSAKDLLGVEASPIPYPQSRYADSAALELELICIRCFHFESECECPSGYATVVWTMSRTPWAKKPYGEFPVPEWLASTVSMRTAHIAAGVANCFWPIMSLGMIPIFDNESLVLVKSRALDRCPDSREFMLRLLGPMTQCRTQKCSCGCEEAICSRAALRHNLYSHPGALEQATSTTYQIGEGSWMKTVTAVTLGNGITCLSERASDLVNIDTDSIEDYLLASVLDSLKIKYTTQGKWSNLISWDGVLNSWIITRLLWSKGISHYSPFACKVTTKGAAEYRNGCRLVMRSECLGTGTGVMVLDLPINAVGPQRLQLPVATLPAHNASHLLLELGKLQKDGQYRDCTTAPPGQGWEQLSIQLNSLPHPEFLHPAYRSDQVGLNLTARVGACGRPRPGFRCTMGCKKGVRAYCCGFTSPSRDINEITVYVITVNHSVAFLAIAEYAQALQRRLYLVDQRSCIGCTVLQASPGSIVAGILPNVSLE